MHETHATNNKQTQQSNKHLSNVYRPHNAHHGGAHLRPQDAILINTEDDTERDYEDEYDGDAKL